MSILEKYSAAMANKDEAAMNELLHDDFKFTMHKSGNTLGKGDAETVIGMKVAFLNSGLMEQLMIHEVFDYNKAFGKASDAAKSVTKPAE